MLMIGSVMKEMQSADSRGLMRYAIVLVSVTLIGTLILSPAISSLMDIETRISSTGSIARTAEARSGSVEDIQAAVDVIVAAGGDTVYVPRGNFSFEAWGRYPNNADRHIVEFVVPPQGLRLIGAGIDLTVLQMPIDDTAPNSQMIVAHGVPTSGRFEMEGITLKGRPNIDVSPTGDELLRIETCIDFRVHNCSFYYAGSAGIRVNDCEVTYGHPGSADILDRISQGVIDHCYFYDIYKKQVYLADRGYGYGVSVGVAYHDQWTPTAVFDDPWQFFGTYNHNVFIEDCEFYGCRHSVQAAWAGCYVLRHCLLEDNTYFDSATTGHPVREHVYGMGECEIYDCIIRYRGAYPNSVRFSGPLIESGSALIFNNRFENLLSYIQIGNAECNTNPFYPLGNTKEVYIWNNTVIDCQPLNIIDEGPNGGPLVQENVDYFLHAPDSSKGYQPYPYPLTLG